jgi:hypothetical protein
MLDMVPFTAFRVERRPAGSPLRGALDQLPEPRVLRLKDNPRVQRLAAWA